MVVVVNNDGEGDDDDCDDFEDIIKETSSQNPST